MAEANEANEANQADEANQANRAAHAEADRTKADLSVGAQTVVDKGDSPTPPARQDPFAARKALFAKSNARHASDVQTNRDRMNDPLAAAMEREARGDSADATPAPQPAPPSHDVHATVTPPSQTADPYVTLVHDGRSVRVARTDIERAGGERLYLRQRHADDIEANLAEQAASLEAAQAALVQQNEQLAMRQAEWEQRHAAGHEDPAQSPRERHAGQDRTARSGDQAADLDARSIELAAQIYSGQPADTAEAVKSLLMDIEQARLDGERRLADVQAKLDQARTVPPPAPAPAPAAPVVDPRWEAQRKAINAMGERDFPELSRNPVLCQRVAGEMQRLSALPENAQRRAMDIAIEACEAIQRDVGLDARSDIRQMKQGLPVIPTAGGSAPVPAEEQPLTNNAYIEMLAKRRQFGH